MIRYNDEKLVKSIEVTIPGDDNTRRVIALGNPSTGKLAFYYALAAGGAYDYRVLHPRFDGVPFDFQRWWSTKSYLMRIPQYMTFPTAPNNWGIVGKFAYGTIRKSQQNMWQGSFALRNKNDTELVRIEEINGTDNKYEVYIQGTKKHTVYVPDRKTENNSSDTQVNYYSRSFMIACTKVGRDPKQGDKSRIHIQAYVCTGRSISEGSWVKLYDDSYIGFSVNDIHFAGDTHYDSHYFTDSGPSRPTEIQYFGYAEGGVGNIYSVYNASYENKIIDVSMFDSMMSTYSGQFKTGAYVEDYALSGCIVKNY